MRPVNIYKRGIGVNFDEKGLADIVIWAPFAENVHVHISNQTDLQLLKGNEGYWTVKTSLLKPGMAYGIMIDDNEPLPDPASLFQPEGVHQLSSVVKINSFDWTDDTWQNPELKDYIFYELHVGTFTSNPTFAGVEKKLDYLVDLGVTAVEIMPVAQFPGERNWGYDGVLPFAVQNSYGGPDELKKLIDSCHKKGLAVVLDVVYNHLGPEGNYLPNFGPYLTDKYKTPWGCAINFDDAWCDGVRNYFIENALMWFRDFHIDALRMDAVHAIKDLNTKHILQEIADYTKQLIKATGKQHYLIIECDLNDTRFLAPETIGGFGTDAQWTDEFHHALRVTAGQKREGYYADFNGLESLAKAYKDAYVYTGQYSEERHKSFGSETKEISGDKFVVFSQNHDQVGNRMLGERTSNLVSFEMQKLLAAAVFVSPFLPMLFMGEEYGESNPFLYFVSHSDPELIAAVRNGRKEEFKSFSHTGEIPDPEAIETFNRSKLQWNLINEGNHQVMFNYYKALISLRKGNTILNSLNREKLDVETYPSQNVLVLTRWNEQQQLKCVMNFSVETESIAITNIGQEIFNSAATQWNGPGISTAHAENDYLTLQPQSVAIYIKENV